MDRREQTSYRLPGLLSSSTLTLNAAQQSSVHCKIANWKIKSISNCTLIRAISRWSKNLKMRLKFKYLNLFVLVLFLWVILRSVRSILFPKLNHTNKSNYLLSTFEHRHLRLRAFSKFV